MHTQMSTSYLAGAFEQLQIVDQNFFMYSFNPYLKGNKSEEKKSLKFGNMLGV